jgi:RNA polymerase primary sigma factor
MPEDYEKEIQSLLKKGKQQGFVSQEEVLAAVPDVEDNIEKLDEIYAALLDKGIEVTDKREQMIWGEDGDSEEGDAPESNAADFDEYVDDSVRMYLKEIGKISLINQEKEVELEKKILKGDKRAKKELAEANLRLVVSIAKIYRTWFGFIGPYRRRKYRSIESGGKIRPHPRL